MRRKPDHAVQIPLLVDDIFLFPVNATLHPFLRQPVGEVYAFTKKNKIRQPERPADA